MWTTVAIKFYGSLNMTILFPSFPATCQMLWRKITQKDVIHKWIDIQEEGLEKLYFRFYDFLYKTVEFWNNVLCVLVGAVIWTIRVISLFKIILKVILLIDIFIIHWDLLLISVRQLFFIVDFLNVPWSLSVKIDTRWIDFQLSALLINLVKLYSIYKFLQPY